MGYTFVIGSFNTNRMNYNTSQHPKIDNVASIIRNEGFDVVALQEVCRQDSLMELCGKLPGTWSFSYSNPPAETYGRAFIWNANRLRLVNGKMPYLRNDYHTEGQHIRLKRDPYYARFTAEGLGGPGIEIRLLNLHLEPDLISIKFSEYLTLAEDVHPKFRHYIELNDHFQIPAYTVSMGDYNLTNRQCSKIYKGLNFYTVQAEATTISNKFNTYTLNDYDHFSYDPDNLDGFGIHIERVDAVNKYFKGDFQLYRENVSDHVPIKLMLSF